MPLRGVFVEFQSLSKSRRVQTSVLPKKAYFLRTLMPIFFSRDGNWEKTPRKGIKDIPGSILN